MSISNKNNDIKISIIGGGLAGFSVRMIFLNISFHTFVFII